MSVEVQKIRGSEETLVREQRQAEREHRANTNLVSNEFKGFQTAR